jgi:hypothetical protein
LTVVGGTPERFAQFLAAEMAKWQRLVQEAGFAAAADPVEEPASRRPKPNRRPAERD